MRTFNALLIGSVAAGMTEIKHTNRYTLEYGVEGTDVMIGYKVTSLTGQTRDRVFTSTTVLY